MYFASRKCKIDDLIFLCEIPDSPFSIFLIICIFFVNSSSYSLLYGLILLVLWKHMSISLIIDLFAYNGSTLNSSAIPECWNWYQLKPVKMLNFFLHEIIGQLAVLCTRCKMIWKKYDLFALLKRKEKGHLFACLFVLTLGELHPKRWLLRWENPRLKILHISTL